MSMIKIILPFCFLMGLYCESTYKCIKYTGELEGLTDKAEQCEGARCWRVHYTGTPETVSLQCLNTVQSLSDNAEYRMKLVRDHILPNSVFSTAKEEDLKLTVCAGDLCNTDVLAVNDFTSACTEHSLHDWYSIDYSNSEKCFGGRCSKTTIGQKVLLGCTDDLGCTEEHVNTVQQKAMDEFQELTGFVAAKEDVKTTCCQGSWCSMPQPSEFSSVGCYDFSEKLADVRNKLSKDSPRCMGEMCRYSIGGDRVLMECANAAECKLQNLAKVKKNAFEKLSVNNQNLTTASDVKTSCCSADFCNFADKPASESFAVTCHNYAGNTSDINLENTCLGETCVTINYEGDTELSCYSKLFCETSMIAQTKRHLVERHGGSLKEGDIEVTCCDGDKCNNAAHLIASTASPAANAASLSIISQSIIQAITLFLF